MRDTLLWRVGVGHPGARRLDAYVDARLDAASRAGVARHLTRCEACRNDVADMRRVGELARAAAAVAPALPPGSLERVLARRAAGERAILPVTDAMPAAEERAHPHGPRMGRGTAAAVWLATAAALVVLTRLPERVMSLPFVSGDSTGLAELRVYDRAIRLDPARFKPAVLRYRTSTVTDSVHTSVVAETEVDISRGRWGERDAWVVRSHLVSSFVPRQRELPSDVLYLDPAKLAMLGQETSVTMGVRSATWGAEVMSDSASLRRVLARENLAPVPVPFVVTYAAERARSARASWNIFRLEFELDRRVGISSLDIGVQALPLARNWSARVPLTPAGLPSWLPPNVPRERGIESTTLRVVGEERVRVPAGEFDCWEVEVTGGPRIFPRQNFVRHTMWVAKEGGWTVKRVETIAHTATGGTTDYVRELTALTPRP
jgi:anti-sigma factor RsiW